MLSSFTWIDWAIVTVIIASAVISLGRGLVKEVMSLASWGIALLVAWRLGTPMSSYLEGYIETPSVRIITASVALFIVTLMIGALISRALSGLIKVTGLGGLDRLLGIVFGAARGALLASILVGMLSVSPLAEDSAWQNSTLLPNFLQLSDWAKRQASEILQSQQIQL